MSDTRAVVSKIESGGIVWVQPVLEGMCISCEDAPSCTRRGSAFKVENRAELPIRLGDTVVIAASRTAKTAQGLYALLFPVAFAGVGYALVPRLALFAGVSAGEGLRAAGVLVFMAAAAGIVLATGKFAKKVVRPEITGVEDK